MTAPVATFAHLVESAVNEPGIISSAYRAFHNYSFGNQLLAWSQCAQRGMLKWLSDVTKEHPNPLNEIKLWSVRKGERELTCVAIYLPPGIDVRLMEGADSRRTQLVRDSREVGALSDKWQKAFLKRGWIQQ